MRVDVNAHYYPSTYIDLLKRNGKDTSWAMQAPCSSLTLDQRINLNRERGLDLARDQRGCSPPLETPFNCARLKRRG
jgi:hypothetical protein